MGKVDPFSKPWIYIIVAAYILVGFSTLIMNNTVANFVFQEDHYFENVGAISFFAASILFFLCFLMVGRLPASHSPHLIKYLVFLGLAVLFFFAAGEEISWGQRIFHVQTPQEIIAVNQQGETNIHNLWFFKKENFSFERAFDVFWLVFVVILPLVARFYKPFEKFAGRFLAVIPHWGIGLLFILNYLWAKVAKVIFASKYSFSVVPFVQAVQEIKESNYSLLFALVALFIALRMRGLISGQARVSSKAVPPNQIDEVRKI